MNKEKIKISYKDLRKLSEDLISSISEQILVKKEKITLRSSINNELGIDGDDWFDLQERLKAEFGYDFSDFDFRYYFNEEGEQTLNLPLITADRVFRITASGIIIFFNKNLAKRIWRNRLIRNKPDLQIQDILTSILKKRFVVKEQVVYELV